jgi:hypothetical protein
MEALKKLVKGHRKPVGSMKKHELEDYARRHHLHVSLMTKEEVLEMIKISGCKMLQGMKLHKMTREQIIEVLHEKACPELQRYL